MTPSDLPFDLPSARVLRLRPFAGDSDFPLMAVVANASFAADGIESVRRAKDMRRDYAAMTRWDPSRDIVMAELDGRLVGYARTWDWTTGEGALVQGQIAFVHPDHRRQGFGGALLHWLEARQREFARGRAGATAWLHQAMVTEGERDRAHLLRRAGYQAVRHFLDMERPGSTKSRSFHCHMASKCGLCSLSTCGPSTRPTCRRWRTSGVTRRRSPGTSTTG